MIKRIALLCKLYNFRIRLWRHSPCINSVRVSCKLFYNAGAYTHTSVAIRDALLGTAIPFFEIHISNVHAREEFRHHSYLSDKAIGVIVGFGLDGYEFALRKAARLVNK